MAKKKAVAAAKFSGPHAEKLAVFVETYLSNGGNASKAAIAAGYSAKTAKQAGSRLLTRVDVSTQVEARRKALQTAFELTTERTLREVARLAYFRPRDILAADGSVKPLTEWSDDALACIVPTRIEFTKSEDGKVTGQTVDLKAWDKNAALEKAMKFAGLFEQDNKQKPRGADLRVRFIQSPNIPKPGTRAK